MTDANLILGRLPASLLGGEIALNAEAARRAIEERIAGPLGLSTIEAAEGILEIVNNNLVGAIRTVSIARGLDPRDFALIAFGGAGPLQASALAEALGIETVLIPPHPGVLSTEGLLRTDLRNDYVQTCPQLGPDYDVDRLNAILEDLERRATNDLEREQIPPDRRRLRRAADLRYLHQGYELSVEIPAGPLTAETLPAIEDAFHQEHCRLYTYDLRGQSIELVNLRVTATGLLPHADHGRMETGGAAGGPPGDEGGPGAPPPVPAPATATGRDVYFGREHGWLATPAYARDKLTAGTEIVGPAAIDQVDSTTILWPSQHARVDALGNLIARVPAQALPG